MKKIDNIIILSIITESLITYFNSFFGDSKFHFSMLLSVILGVIIAISYNLDLIENLELKSNIPYIGNILTGILISRGSNCIFDILKGLNKGV